MSEVGFGKIYSDVKRLWGILTNEEAAKAEQPVTITVSDIAQENTWDIAPFSIERIGQTGKIYDTQFATVHTQGCDYENVLIKSPGDNYDLISTLEQMGIVLKELTKRLPCGYGSDTRVNLASVVNCDHGRRAGTIELRFKSGNSIMVDGDCADIQEAVRAAHKRKRSPTGPTR